MTQDTGHMTHAHIVYQHMTTGSAILGRRSIVCTVVVRVNAT